MSDIESLKSRARVAIAKLKGNQQSVEASAAAHAAQAALKAENEALKEKLEREERTHLALQNEFMDVCQEYGSMELEMIEIKKNPVDSQSVSTPAPDGLEALRRAREDDIEEVEKVLAKIAPLVGD